MSRFCAVLLLALLSSPGSAYAEPLLQIDYGGRLDGKYACTPAFTESTLRHQLACADPITDLEIFTRTVDAQWTSNPSCHGITLFRHPWGTLPLDRRLELVSRPHWRFFLDAYSPGDKKQKWTLLDPDLKVAGSGESRPKEIVRDVCNIVAGLGGTMLR
jgi:hypothetical protein